MLRESLSWNLTIPFHATLVTHSHDMQLNSTLRKQPFLVSFISLHTSTQRVLGVGKSSILQQFTDGYFSENLQSTIGVDFKVKVMTVMGPDDKPKRIKVTIWDTAGMQARVRMCYGVSCLADWLWH
jgi:hypothetical protein